MKWVDLWTLAQQLFRPAPFKKQNFSVMIFHMIFLSVFIASFVILLVLGTIRFFHFRLESRLLGPLPHIQIYDKVSGKKLQEWMKSQNIEGSVHSYFATSGFLHHDSKNTPVSILFLPDALLAEFYPSLLQEESYPYAGYMHLPHLESESFLAQLWFLTDKEGNASSKRIDIIPDVKAIKNWNPHLPTLILPLAGLENSSIKLDTGMWLKNYPPESLIQWVTSQFSSRDVFYSLQKYQHISQALFLENAVTKLVLFLILFLCATLIYHALSNLIADYAPHFSLLYLLGLEKNKIPSLFFLQGVISCIQAMSFGFLLNYILFRLVQNFSWVKVSFPFSFSVLAPQASEAFPLPWDISDILFTCFSITGVFIFSIFIPLRRIQHLKPTEGLRYDS